MSAVIKPMEKLASASTWISALCIVAMMGVTCLDVILRALRVPMAGAYETVGYLGALMVAFALADTTLKGGHIRVEFLVEKLSEQTKKWVGRAIYTTLIVLFSIVTWRMAGFTLELKEAAEVSMTLRMPVWPVLAGITTGLTLFVGALVASIR